MTGPHWMLRHVDFPKVECIVTDAEYDALVSSDDWPDGVLVRSLNLVPLDEFLAKLKARAGSPE